MRSSYQTQTLLITLVVSRLMKDAQYGVSEPLDVMLDHVPQTSIDAFASKHLEPHMNLRVCVSEKVIELIQQFNKSKISNKVIFSDIYELFRPLDDEQLIGFLSEETPEQILRMTKKTLA